MTSRMELELAELLSRRIRTAVRDILDTGRRGGVPEHDCLMSVLTVLMSEAVTGLLAYGAGEKEIARMAIMSCREIEKQMKAIEARQAKMKH